MKKFSITKKNINIRWTIVQLLILISSSFMCSALEFSEIMFNPDGSDTGREWIELKTAGECINLSRLKLFEGETNHNIYPYNRDVACEYAVICNDINKFLEEHPSFWSNTTADNESNNITLYRSVFSLSNTGEEIAIKKGTDFLAYMNYSLILSYVQVSEGYSLEYYDDAWRQSNNVNGTPGMDERTYLSVDENISETYNTTLNETANETYDTTINETYDINITVNETVNITVNYTNVNDTNINNTNNTNISYNNTDIIENNTVENDTDGCRVSINITIKNESTIYENGVQIRFFNKLMFENKPEGLNYSIEYWIEDINGKIFKNRILTDNQGEKTFTPNIEESDKVLMIKNSIKDAGQCQIIIQSSEKMLLIRYPSFIEKTCQKSNAECKADKKVESRSCICDNFSYDNKNCSQKPIMNVNVCNHTTNEESQKIQKKVNNNTKDLNLYDKRSSIQNVSSYGIQSNNSMLMKPNASANGQTTGMIIYESPNIKNRFYAIVGFMLVGLTSIGKIGHTLFKKIRNKNGCKQQ